MKPGGIAASKALFRQLLILALSGSLPAAAQDRSEYLGPYMPYSKFDERPHATIVIDGSPVDVAFVPEQPGQRREIILAWIRDSANAITAYVGRFPVRRLRVLVVQVPGNRVRGTTWGHQGAAIRITLGERVQEADLLQNWVSPMKWFMSRFHKF